MVEAFLAVQEAVHDALPIALCLVVGEEESGDGAEDLRTGCGPQASNPFFWDPARSKRPMRRMSRYPSVRSFKRASSTRVGHETAFQIATVCRDKVRWRTTPPSCHGLYQVWRDP